MATMQQQPPNIWGQMSYIPPRGPCSQKLSMLTTCPCYRFMIHPMKAATSFDCDGCGHHASFHQMQNEQEEEVAKRWRAEEAERASFQSMLGANPNEATRQDVLNVMAHFRKQIMERDDKREKEVLILGDEERVEGEGEPVVVGGGRKRKKRG